MEVRPHRVLSWVVAREVSDPPKPTEYLIHHGKSLSETGDYGKESSFTTPFYNFESHYCQRSIRIETHLLLPL